MDAGALDWKVMWPTREFTRRRTARTSTPVVRLLAQIDAAIMRRGGGKGGRRVGHGPSALTAAAS